MPKRDVILNLPGFTIKKISGYDPIVLEVNYRRKARCPDCHTLKLRKKASFMRTIRHELFGIQRTLLRVKSHKFYCLSVIAILINDFPASGNTNVPRNGYGSKCFISTRAVFRKRICRVILS